MAYLTKGPLGYYVNRQFVLPTPVGDAIVGAAGRGRMGYYTGRRFVLPTSSTVRNQQIAAAAQTAKKSCACKGSCGHCGGKKYRRMGRLGDDTDFSDFTYSGPDDTSSISPYAGVITDPSLVPSPTDYANWLTPGPGGLVQQGQTSSIAAPIASSIGSVISSLFAPRPSTGTLTAAQQQALALQQQSSLTAPIAGIGLSPLTLGAIGIGVIVLIAVSKSGEAPMNAQFTGQEREIIRCMCEGAFSDKELAQALSLSPNTVKVHVLHIANKLREQLGREDISRMDMVIYWILTGYADTGKLREKYAIPDERMAAAAPL